MKLALEKMIKKYNPSDLEEGKDAMREIVQRVILLSLSNRDFFKIVSFCGDTSLRLLHGLPRVSKNLTFSLMRRDKEFDFAPYEEEILLTLKSFGLHAESKQLRGEAENRSTFLKTHTLKYLLDIEVPEYLSELVDVSKIIKIIIEIDIDSPTLFQTEKRVLTLPKAFMLTSFDLPTLFASKMHAILCRSWKEQPNGRDWYDMNWYIKNEAKLNFAHLNKRVLQAPLGIEKKIAKLGGKELSRNEFIDLLRERISKLDIAKIKDDAHLSVRDKKETAVWSKDFFTVLIYRIDIE